MIDSLKNLAGQLSECLKSDLRFQNEIITTGLLRLYGRPGYRPPNSYAKVAIPKNSGGKRILMVPKKPLKIIQKAIHLLVQARFVASEISHGFVGRKSIITNAGFHLEKKYVFQVDIKNFFHSIPREAIEKVLNDISLSKYEAKILAEICCFELNERGTKSKVLPQGSPASPILSNLILKDFDTELVQLAKSFNLGVTRYADDISFSSGHFVFERKGDFKTRLYSLVEKHGFKVHSEKTRLRIFHKQQKVTGLVVNEFCNVPRHFVKKLRQDFYFRERYTEGGASKLLFPKILEVVSDEVLKGKIEFIGAVKGKDSAMYLKFIERLVKLK